MELRRALELHKGLMCGKDPDLADTLSALAGILSYKGGHEAESVDIHLQGVKLLTKVPVYRPMNVSPSDAFHHPTIGSRRKPR